MPLPNVNPTQTKAWEKLENHFESIKNVHMKTMFADNPNRANDFTIQVP